MCFKMQLVATMWKGPKENPACAGHTDRSVWEGIDDAAHSKGISNNILSVLQSLRSGL